MAKVLMIKQLANKCKDNRFQCLDENTKKKKKKKKKPSDFLHKNKIKETKKTFKYNLKFINGFLKNI